LIDGKVEGNIGEADITTSPQAHIDHLVIWRPFLQLPTEQKSKISMQVAPGPFG
jgi:hypothetical protein